MSHLRLAILVSSFARTLILLSAFPLFNGVAAEDSHVSAPGEVIQMTSGVALRPLARPGRPAVSADPIQSLVIKGIWKPPVAGERFFSPETAGITSIWEVVRVNTNGWFEHRAMQGGYFYTTIVSPQHRVMLLAAQGHAMVYVNGEPRAGDAYQYGYMKLPVLLKPGTNEFLFQCGRGRLKSELIEPKSGLFFESVDPTFPDLVAGQRPQAWAAQVVVNATTEWKRNLLATAQVDRGKSITTMLPAIPPLATRKVGFQFDGRVVRTNDPGQLRVALIQRENHHDTVLDKSDSKLRIRRPDQTRRTTFVSQIDGSVQYYALNPVKPLSTDAERPALFLTLHGASVEALGQADAYSGKTWGHLVAPTNRRPYGYDWEDWGRMDALEVLDLAQRTLATDPHRIYLTGHSMGGHGAWHLGALYPDKFAAIGPSAGWISFQSYSPRRGTQTAPKLSAVEKLFARASAPSDTMVMGTNFLHNGIFILHGDADDNVPVAQARTMRDFLTKFHHDFQYHEQKGAGHWWDASDEPGTDCVDWPAMYDLFARRTRPDLHSVRRIQFTTVNPGISSSCDWAAIEAQTAQMEPSSIDLQWDPWSRRFFGKTINVARLRLDMDALPKGATFKVEFDGQALEKINWPSRGKIWFEKRAGTWIPSREAAKYVKGPNRYGPFKEAFHHRMIFVYGTQGTAEENTWAYAKARFDAETFYYRGNGSVDIMSDREFNPNSEPDRSVILYGNADSNGAWPALVGSSPVQVSRGTVRVGKTEKRGGNLGCLFIRPRPGSEKASVAVVCGTGSAGMRVTDRLPYLSPGVGFPDIIVCSDESPGQTNKELICAGFFGVDWELASGEVVWQD